MNQKTYPVLYVQKIATRLYKHCGIYPTLYFKIEENEKLKDTPYYAQYMKKIESEVPKAIIHQFTMSQPVSVTNERIVFILFKDNIDLNQVKNFCMGMLEELEFYTKEIHTGQYACLDTMLMEMDRPASPFKFNKVGEKLTQTNLLDSCIEILNGHENPQDNGILTTFEDFIQENEED